MHKKEFQRRMAYEALIILALLALLLFITRLWPILLLVILGIFIAALRLLFLSTRKVPETKSAPLHPPAEASRSHQPRMLSGNELLIRQISDRVALDYPSARWVWQDPNAILQLARGEPMFILLNRAGGYRRAQVFTDKGKLIRLEYCTASEETPSVPTTVFSTEKEEEADDPLLVNYDLLAFEWVEAHLLDLNGRINEAIGLGQKTVVLRAAELPVPESWNAICTELKRNGLLNVSTDAEGIEIKIEQ